MPRITISYRRDDSLDITGRIFEHLSRRYGRESVFRDIDNIPPGVDFRKHINSVIDESDIVLAIIGPRWIGPRANQSRLANAADPVRVEIETALRKGRPLIPILVQRARMPRVEQLPESLHDFAFRNAVEVDSGRDFDHHMTGLIRSVDLVLNRAEQPLASATIEPPVTEIDALRAEIEALRTANRSLQSAASSPTAAMPQVAADSPPVLAPPLAEAGRAEIEALRVAEQSLESALDSITVAHRKLEQRLARLREEDSATAIDSAHHETALTSLQRSISIITEERDELRAKLTALEARLADLMRRTLMQMRAF